MKVRTILDSKGTDVATMSPDATIGDVARKMAEARFGSMVISADGRRADGIVDERAVLHAIATQGPSALEQPIRSILDGSPETCRPDASLDDVMRAMTDKRTRHVIVLEHGVIAGIISIGDAVKSRMDELELQVEAMRDYVASGG